MLDKLGPGGQAFGAGCIVLVVACLLPWRALPTQILSPGGWPGMAVGWWGWAALASGVAGLLVTWLWSSDAAGRGVAIAAAAVATVAIGMLLLEVVGRPTSSSGLEAMSFGSLVGLLGAAAMGLGAVLMFWDTAGSGGGGDAPTTPGKKIKRITKLTKVIRRED